MFVCLLQVSLHLLMDHRSSERLMGVSFPGWDNPQCDGALGVTVTTVWYTRQRQLCKGACSLHKPGPGIILSKVAVKAYDSLDMASHERVGSGDGGVE